MKCQDCGHQMREQVQQRPNGTSCILADCVNPCCLLQYDTRAKEEFPLPEAVAEGFRKVNRRLLAARKLQECRHAG